MAQEGYLPLHKAQLGTAREVGRNRSQIRAVVAAGQHTRADLDALAVRLAGSHSFEHALVMFFDDPCTLDGWDGTGAVEDRDQRHWLYQVVVDGGSVSSSRVAVDYDAPTDPASGQPAERGEVFRAD